MAEPKTDLPYRSIYLGMSLLKRLDKFAQARGLSASEVVRQALIEYLDSEVAEKRAGPTNHKKEK